MAEPLVLVEQKEALEPIAEGKKVQKPEPKKVQGVASNVGANAALDRLPVNELANDPRAGGADNTVTPAVNVSSKTEEPNMAPELQPIPQHTPAPGAAPQSAPTLERK